MTETCWKLTRWLSVLGLLAFGLIWGGCRSVEPVSFASSVGKAYPTVCRFEDWLEIRCLGGCFVSPQRVRVEQDGTITLPDIGAVVVTNKTVSELQAELTALYRKYYNHLSFEIIPIGRLFYVGGEVRTPGPKAYIGKTTVSRAIQAAGDFTEAANKKKVKLICSEGRSKSIVVVDLRKAIQPSHDPPVYPGDRIEVPRKWWH